MKAHQEEYGLNRSLALIGLSKSSWYYNQNKKVALEDKYAYLRPILEEIALTHPQYGYRRVGHELKREQDQVINHKVLQKLNLLWGLPLMRSTRKPKVSKIRKAIAVAGDRANLVMQKPEIQPFEVLYSDAHSGAWDAGCVRLGNRLQRQHGSGIRCLAKNESVFEELEDRHKWNNHASGSGQRIYGISLGI